MKMEGWVMKMKSRQAGAVLMARALLVVGILVVMLIILIWLKKDREEQALARHKAEQAQVSAATAPQPQASAATPANPRPIGHGLSFALAVDGRAPADVVRLTCEGAPGPVDQPRDGACNPEQGDTSCRTVLPVLCFKPAGAPVPPGVEADMVQGWTSGILGATQPVMGAILDSEAAASARCEKELGAGWRMAEVHDGGDGRGLTGLRASGLLLNTRFWVQVNDQKGNCWNSGG